VADLFDPVAPADRLSTAFKQVADAPGYRPARASMSEVFGRMGSRDPNFIEQFQTTGFDARVTELYLFAALVNAGFDVSSVGEAPDFNVKGRGYEWALEVTTSNPSGGQAPASLPDSINELQRYIDGELVVRLGSALFSKLQRRYWELPHVTGKPFVLAIQHFASEEAQRLTDTALIDYLYGLRTFGEVDEAGELKIYNAEIAEHAGSKTIPSNFFGIPEAAHISAVLWTNSGTVAKFARMGYQQGLQAEGIKMVRRGLRYQHDPDAGEPAAFAYEVDSRREPWEEGLVMAHNPRAKFPLPEEAFPGIVHHELADNGLIASTIPAFHAFQSQTVIVVEA